MVMVKTQEKPKVKASIPSKLSVILCYALSYFCVVFGIGMLVLAIYGFYAEKTHAVKSAIAGHNGDITPIQALIDIYPVLFCVTAYFFFVSWGMFKVSSHRKDLREMAQVLRNSRNKHPNEIGKSHQQNSGMTIKSK